MNDITSLILTRLATDPHFLSGETLCHEFGITRSAVWKHIRLLRNDGYQIEAITGKGYRLGAMTGRPIQAEVQPLLNCQRFGNKLHYHRVATSTNLLAKALAGEGAPEGSIVVADSQSAGRGRMGRTWVSPPDLNLYFSLILRPAVPSIRVPQLTLLVAVAIHRALQALSPELEPMIKWPNDILVNGKKLCGVLCEMQSEPDLTHFVVVGIGINVNQHEMPAELEKIATSLLLESGKQCSRPELLATVLNQFEPLYNEWLLQNDLGFILPYLEKYSMLQSKRVTIDQRNQHVNGIVTGIAPGGELQLQNDDGAIILISSGEANLQKT